MKYIAIFLALMWSVASAKDLSKVKDFQIKEVESLGRQIYEQDIIAAEATDVLFAQGIDLSKFPIRGWVVEENQRTSVVTFIAEYDNETVERPPEKLDRE